MGKSKILSVILLILSAFTAAASEPQTTEAEYRTESYDNFDAVLRASPKLATSYRRDLKTSTGHTSFITLTNISDTTITSWRVRFILDEGQSLASVAGAQVAQIDGQEIEVENTQWNAQIRPGQNVSFGYEVRNPGCSSSKQTAVNSTGYQSLLSSPGVSFNLAASYAIDNQWTTGYQVTVTLKNNSLAPSGSWQSTFNLPVGQTITSFWNGVYSQSGTAITVNNPTWIGGGVIAAGGSTTYGMVISRPVNGQVALLNLKAVADGTVQPIPPQAPVLNTVMVDPQNPSNYTVSWSDVSGATSYTLQQDISNTFSNPKVVAQGYLHSQNFVSQPNGTYYYRVLAANSAGSSAWSNVQKIVINVPPVVLAAPVLQSINNPSGSNVFQLNWSAVNKAQGYTVQQSTTSTFSNPSTVYSGANTTAPISVAAVGKYYYRVSAYAGTSKGPQSNVVNTTVSKVPSQAPIIDAYWESWNSKDSVSAIVNMHVDVINISFGNFISLPTPHTFQVAGVQCDQATLNSLVSQAHALGKKVKISIGGASYPISPQLKTLEDAQGMAQAINIYIQNNNLDGVDIDIEDQTPANLQVALFQYLRQLMPNALITYAPETPASTAQPFASVIQGAYQYMSYLSIQAYNNYKGYRYQDDVAALMKSFGVPASKINVGLMPGNDDTGVFTSLAAVTQAAQYIVQAGLKGIMFWDLNRDYENVTGLGPSAATNAAWSVFHP